MYDQDYVRLLEEHKIESEALISRYKKLIDQLQREIDMHITLESSLKKMICYVLESNISDDLKRKILDSYKS